MVEFILRYGGGKNSGFILWKIPFDSCFASYTQLKTSRNYVTVESLQSHFILTMSHWSSGLPVCFPTQETWVQNPWVHLCETWILLLALSRFIGDPDVIDHFCGLVWGGLRPKPSLGSRADNVIIPLDLTQLFCPGFMQVSCRSSFRLHIQRSRLLGGSPAESLQSHFILTMSHWSSGLPVYFPTQGTWVQNPWVHLCETGNLLLALSRYSMFHLWKWLLRITRNST
jgi:hypothetical protein